VGECSGQAQEFSGPEQVSRRDVGEEGGEEKPVAVRRGAGGRTEWVGFVNRSREALGSTADRRWDMGGVE
jgi:hypothetical protein